MDLTKQDKRCFMQKDSIIKTLLYRSSMHANAEDLVFEKSKGSPKSSDDDTRTVIPRVFNASQVSLNQTLKTIDQIFRAKIEVRKSKLFLIVLDQTGAAYSEIDLGLAGKSKQGIIEALSDTSWYWQGYLDDHLVVSGFLPGAPYKRANNGKLAANLIRHIHSEFKQKMDEQFWKLLSSGISNIHQPFISLVSLLPDLADLKIQDAPKLMKEVMELRNSLAKEYEELASLLGLDLKETIVRLGSSGFPAEKKKIIPTERLNNQKRFWIRLSDLFWYLKRTYGVSSENSLRVVIDDINESFVEAILKTPLKDISLGQMSDVRQSIFPIIDDLSPHELARNDVSKQSEMLSFILVPGQHRDFNTQSRERYIRLTLDVSR